MSNPLRAAVLALAFGCLPAFAGDPPSPPPTAAQKELQAPLTLEDGKPTQAAEGGPSALRAFGSLLVVLGLAGGGAWALKRWGKGRLPGTGGGKLKLEETLALGDRRFVSILQAEGERFLIALHPNGVNLLARLDGMEAGEAYEGPFDEALGKQMQVTRPVPVKEMEALLKGGKKP
jgi:flagellar biogenesis protein FliO